MGVLDREREGERKRDFIYIFANINTRCKPRERDERCLLATRDRVEGYSARLASDWDRGSSMIELIDFVLLVGYVETCARLFMKWITHGFNCPARFYVRFWILLRFIYLRSLRYDTNLKYRLFKKGKRVLFLTTGNDAFLIVNVIFFGWINNIFISIRSPLSCKWDIFMTNVV